MTPNVICHIMASVDGRLLPDRWTPPFDGTKPAELFKEYAAIGKTLGTDAWMFGKATAREAFPYKFVPKVKEYPQAGEIHIGKRGSERMFVTVDPDADIFYTSDTLRGDHIITIIGTNATLDYLDMLREKDISYIVLDDPTDLCEGLEILHDRFGIRSISLQGGGIINGAMLAAALIDELSLVIYPGIDGLAASPSIFEYIGNTDTAPAAGQSFELTAVERMNHGIVWLRYKFHKVAD